MANSREAIAIIRSVAVVGALASTGLGARSREGRGNIPLSLDCSQPNNHQTTLVAGQKLEVPATTTESVLAYTRGQLAIRAMQNPEPTQNNAAEYVTEPAQKPPEGVIVDAQQNTRFIAMSGVVFVENCISPSKEKQRFTHAIGKVRNGDSSVVVKEWKVKPVRTGKNHYSGNAGGDQVIQYEGPVK